MLGLRTIEALEAVWRAQGLRVERDGVVHARCRGEVVEIPCELVARAEDGRTLVCVAGRLDEYGPEEVADVVG